MQNTKKMIMIALFAALTCVTTMVIKIPTPTFGYIHPGDGMVLLSGILLGPVAGGAAAGVGSMLADVLAGYMSYAPGTLVIKALTAVVAGMLYAKLHGKQQIRIVLGGAVGECIMVVGYYIYAIGLSMLGGSGFAAAAIASAASIPFNIVQAASGVLIAVILLPVLRHVPIFQQTQNAS